MWWWFGGADVDVHAGGDGDSRGAGSVSPSVSGSHPVAPTPLGYTPSDPARIGHWLVIAPFTPSTPEQAPVLKDYVAFRQALTRAINQQTIDFKVLNAVSVGNSRNGILQMVGERIQKGQFTIGETKVQIRSVQVGKGTATVEVCQDDRSYEVDEQGKTVVPAPGVALFRDKMLLINGKWLVSQSLAWVPKGCTMGVTS